MEGTLDTAPSKFVNAGLDLDATVALTQAQLVQEAVEIAKELQQRAIQAADGSVTGT